jgi:hypothetical protein
MAANADISTILPSVAVNGSIPDVNGIPQPWNARLSSVEAGIGLPGFAGTYTTTPQQIADFLNKYVFGPLGIGPQDRRLPFSGTLQSDAGTIGQPSEPPVRFLSPRQQNPLGGGMSGWGSSLGSADPQQPASGGLPGMLASVAGIDLAHPEESSPGGLLGLFLDYQRNNAGAGAGR